jgi:hypothetical protein
MRIQFADEHEEKLDFVPENVKGKSLQHWLLPMRTRREVRPNLNWGKLFETL